MLYLGTEKIDITPTDPIPLAGFASRSDKGAFEGISHPLYARVLYFLHDSGNGKKTSAILVSSDLIWWGSERVPRLKEQIRERWKVDEVILHATHTHSGPQTSTLFTSLLGKADPSYIDDLESRLLEGIAIASDRMEAVTVDRGKGECKIGINRRGWTREQNVIVPNRSGPVDHDLNVIRFRSFQDRVKALLVHYACHPVTTSDNLVSSEFTGVAMNLLEDSFGGEAVSAYLQGTCGDINPSLDHQFYFGKDPEVCRLGEILAENVREVLNASMEPVETVDIRSQVITMDLRLQRLPTRGELESLSSEPGVKGEWSRMLLQSPECMTDSIPLEMTRLTLAKGLALLAMNAEIVAEYGLFLKQITHGQTLPLPYSNGMFGYVPTAKQLNEGGYEPIDSTYYFAMPSFFAPSIEEQIKNAMGQINEWK